MAPSTDHTQLRDRAEVWLRKSRSDVASMSSYDVAELIYEFQVHQIELKMQNEELRRIEMELQQSGDRYQELYELAPVAYLTLDAGACITQANQEACMLLGVDRDRLLGVRLTQLVLPGDRVRFERQYKEMLADQQPRGWELRIKGADGARVVRLKASTSRPDFAMPSVRVVVLDLTEQRHAEAALTAEVAKRESSERSLRKERDFAQGLIAAVPGILIELDRKGRIVRCNDLFQQLTGYSLDEVRGLDPIELLLPPSAQSATRARFMPLMQGQLSAGETIPIVTRSGQECIVTWNYTSLTNDQGKLTGLLIIGLDITERTRLEASLRQSQKMEAIGLLASGIAHDFNNLLMGLTGLLEIAASKLPVQSPVRPYLSKAKRAAAAGSGLTAQLLDFSRKRPVERATIDLNRLVHRAESMLRCLVPASIELKLQLGGTLWVEGDPGQLEQVLLNLVANARDAMPKGGTLTVSTAAACPRQESGLGAAEPSLESYSTLAVTDTGVGMDEDTQRRVFEPFFTTKAVGKGTGLGLATVYGTVSHSGGHIHLTSAPGQGTTFRVCLPQAERPDTADRQGTPELIVHGDGENILVVEDEDSVRATIRHRLEEHGYCVLTAANGDEALRICRKLQGPIALAITDIILPGAPGDEVAREIVKLRPGTPILYMSALPHEQLVREGRLDTQAVTLQKPFSERELLVAVKEHLVTAAEPSAAATQVPEPTRASEQRVVLLVENDLTGGRSLKELLELAEYTVVTADRADSAVDLLRTGAVIDLVIADHNLPGEPGMTLLKRLLAIRPELGAILLYKRELPQPLTAQAGAETRLRLMQEPLDFEGLLDHMTDLLSPRT